MYLTYLCREIKAWEHNSHISVLNSEFDISDLDIGWFRFRLRYAMLSHPNKNDILKIEGHLFLLGWWIKMYVYSIINHTRQSNCKSFLATGFGSKIDPSSGHYTRRADGSTTQGNRRTENSVSFLLFFSCVVTWWWLDFRAETSRQKSFQLSCCFVWFITE
jgi:hypothetical protein